MQIDLNAAIPGRAGAPTNLPPELDQLLSALKLQIGQTAEAKVAGTLLLTESEKQQMLAMRSADKPTAGQKALLSVLQDPNVKLVELSIRDQAVTTLTNLPLKRNAQIQVLVTPRGLLLIPPAAPQQAAATPLTLPTPGGLPLIPSRNETALPLPGDVAKNPVLSASPSPTKGDAGRAADGISVPVQQLATIKLPTTRPAVVMPDSKTTEPTHTPPAAEPKASPQPLATATPAQKTLLAAATSQALPIAQPLKNLLRSADATQQLLAKAPHTPETAPVKQLSVLLNRVSQQAVDVTSVKPDTIRQAMNTSGVFYERRLLAEAATGGERGTQPTPPLSERDLKGLLIHLAQWSGTPTIAAPAPGGQSSADTLAQLMMSLARLWTPRQAPSKGEPLQQLSHAVREMAEKSLAQIQLQQFRTLNSHLSDTAAPTQWHLDIPLKLPDAYGNLYLQLFEPRLPAEEKKSDRKARSHKQSGGRWRVFLELELDDLGSLAAEISVQDKNVEATLWSGNTDLRQRVHAQLENLRGDLQRQGIEVMDLRCSSNPPPEQKIRLDYALVDIKT